jgi:hypothetical protein
MPPGIERAVEPKTGSVIMAKTRRPRVIEYGSRPAGDHGMGDIENGCDGKSPCRQAEGVEPFDDALKRHGLSLVRGEVHTLQVNTGYLCNLRCRHCHLEAGPGRKEIMSRETMTAVVAFARRFPFRAIDITGGAPELVPDLLFLIEGLAPLAPRLMLRTNLSALSGAAWESLLALCVAHRVALVASFPSTNPSQADAQRGGGVTEAAIAVLRKLNAAGYGVEGTGLELDLVSNPDGAFLPAFQESAERKPPVHVRERTVGAFPDGTAAGGKLRTVHEHPRRSVQPVGGRRAHVPHAPVRIVGRVPVRLRFQPCRGAILRRPQDPRFGRW